VAIQNDFLEREAVMNYMIRPLVSFLISVFMLAGPAVNLALAEDMAKAEKGQATIKIVAESDKVRAYETLYKAGDTNANIVTSALRVVRALHAGTLMRIYADGKTEKVEWKTGEVKILQIGSQYTTKNVGKTDFVTYTVLIK
jgi:hypothetical protein